MLVNWKDVNTWRDPHKKRFWALLLVVIYSLFGFVAVPLILQDQLPKLSQQLLKREASVENVSFNPWSLRLQVDQLRLLDDQAAPLFSLDQLVVNLDVSSIWRFALDFHEVALVAPKVYLVRYTVEDSNIGRLLGDLENSAEPPAEPPPEQETSGPLRLRISNFSISDGLIDTRDEVPTADFTTQITPINISMKDFNTLPDIEGEQQVSLKTENGVEITWTGSLSVAPLVSAGRMELHGSPLPLVHRYFDEQLGVNLGNCCLDIVLDYDIKTVADGTVEAAIDNLSLELLDLEVTEEDDAEPVFTLPALRVSGGKLRWPQNTVHIESVTFEEPAVFVTRETDGNLNLLRIWQQGDQPEPAAKAAPDTDSSDEAPWQVSVGSTRVQGMALTIADRSLQQPGQLILKDIELELLELTNQPDSPAKLKASLSAQPGGMVALEGTLAVAPAIALNTALVVDALALSAAQPWVSEFARIKLQQGGVFIEGDLSSTEEESLLFAGNLAIKDLEIDDTVTETELLSWQSLDFLQVRLGLDGANLEMAGINLIEPSTRLVIHENGSTNFQQLAVPATPTEEGDEPVKEAPQPESESDPFRIRVGTTALKKGSLDYADNSLPLPFRVLIQDFSGTVSGSDSFSDQPSALDFEGRVGEYGLATIKGKTRLTEPTQSSDIVVNFENLSMPDLSGYSAQFAGRKIESGKLNLNLAYTLDDNLIKGDNSIVMKDFTLGDEVDSEDAVDLPLDLAIALLTDANGVIDIDLEISGDIDDPDFSASGVFMQAFAKLINNAVTAPFKLLGGLAGGDNDDLEGIDFQPGRADLQPPEQEKLDQLVEALLQRPNLQLAVPGSYVEVIDKPALQEDMLNQYVKGFLAGLDETDDQQTITKRGIDTLEKLAKKSLPELDVKALRNSFVITDPATGKTEPDEFAYLQELRERLEAVQLVTQAQLEALAQQRQQAIVSYLSTEGKLQATRMHAGLVEAVEKADESSVQVLLDISLEK